MKTRNMLVLVCAAAQTVFLSVTAQAADLYSSGTKTWNTTTSNWGTAPGGPYTTATWNNATPDSAIFEGAAGTVTLAEAISVKNIKFVTANYILTNNTLNFASGGTITNSVAGAQTITAGITGSPSVNIIDSLSAIITFAPTTSTQTLGICTVAYEGGISDKAYLYLSGTTTGNSASSIQYGGANAYGAWYKQGSGTWTVGNVSLGGTLSAGNLVANGTISAGLTVSGGTLHYNNAGASSSLITFSGGNIDNSSGAAITSPTPNPTMAWNSNITFIGSNGSNSDLNLGTGAVTLSNNTLTGNPTLTIQNAATTLSIGGVIGGTGLGLTKAGPGTLKLTGVNTYSGPTAVSAGTLSIGNNSALAGSALDTTGSGILTFNVTTPTIGGLNGSVDLATKFTSGYSSVTTLTLSPGTGITASYSGAIANGSMNLTKSGLGTQILSGNNTYGGTTTVSAGTLVVNTPSALPNYGTAGKVVLNGGTLRIPVDGVTWTMANVDTLLANATKTSGALGIDISSGTQTQASAYNVGSIGLAETGAGTLELNLANTYSGATTVSGGTLLLDGANGAIASSSGITLGSTSGTTGTLTLDNSAADNANRVGSVGITLNNSTLNYIGNATTATTETIGTVTAAAGHNQIVLSGGAPSQVATLTSTNGAVIRNAGATLNILADGTSQQFKFTGGSAGINKGVFYGSAAATANEFAYYPGSGAAVRAPAYGTDANFSAETSTALTSAQHNKLNGSIGSQGAVSIYSLNMPSDYSITALTGNLTFSNAGDQGAIIKTGGNVAQIGTAGNAFDIVGQTGGELVIDTVGAGDNLTLNVGITATTTALTKTGAGTLTLTANRDYLNTGATTVNAGTLLLNSLNTDGFKSTAITINNSGTLKLAGTNKIVNTSAVTVNAGGMMDMAGFSDTIGNLAGSGSVTNSTGTACTLTVGPATATTVTFPGVISGNTALTLGAVNGQCSTFILSGANTYTGLTTLAGANIKLGASNAIKAGNAISVLKSANVGAQWIDLGGYDLTVGALSLSGGWSYGNTYVYNSVGSSKLTLTGGVTTPAGDNCYIAITVTTLDLNNTTQTIAVGDYASLPTDMTISSVIQNGGITKSGTGTLALTGVNTYAGSTTVSAGTLEIGGAGVLGGGTYAANITNNATFSYNSTSNQTISGVISGTGALVKNNTGTLNLTGTNTYSGVTTVSAGTLLVNGSLNSASRVTIASGATLAGAGTMGIVTNNGTLSVGNSVVMGTLTTSNLVMGSGSSYVFDLNGTGSGDSVTVNGNLTLNSSSVITVVPQGVFNGGYTYTLFNYTTVSGTLPTTVLGGNPIRAMTLIDDTANKRIVLKVDGPPGTLISFM